MKAQTPRPLNRPGAVDTGGGEPALSCFKEVIYAKVLTSHF
jgi:hypothetical protein